MRQEYTDLFDSMLEGLLLDLESHDQADLIVAIAAGPRDPMPEVEAAMAKLKEAARLFAALTK